MNYPLLDKELGRKLSAKELAEYFCLDEDIIRKHFQSFGGIRPTGPNGRILFFENLVISAMRRQYALEDNEARPHPLDGSCTEGRGDTTAAVRHESRGPKVGGRRAGCRLVEDRHGVLESA